MLPTYAVKAGMQPRIVWIEAACELGQPVTPPSRAVPGIRQARFEFDWQIIPRIPSRIWQEHRFTGLDRLVSSAW